jgi:hypothetical protein
MIDLILLIQLAEIKKKASRHGSMSQRWWQNRIYGLQFGLPDDVWHDSFMFVQRAIVATEAHMKAPKVSRSSKNNLRGYLNGLRDAKLAIEQRQKEGAK